MGILKKNKCTVVKREDLIGQYLGETTIKTQEMLEECKNGVMLIDEAYSLGSDDNRDSYAKEAIDCINQYLTENVDKIICIIAGYKEELDRCFFSQNKGLRRRFPWRFTINDFNVKELVQIFKDKINDSSLYLLDSNIDDDYLISKFKKEYFKGNGGDIDNIISRIKIVNSKKKFLNNDYIIEKDTIEKSLEKFYDTKRMNTNNNYLHMYL
jgi:AAA+ superfamily predicted ATPase